MVDGKIDGAPGEEPAMQLSLRKFQGIGYSGVIGAILGFLVNQPPLIVGAGLVLAAWGAALLVNYRGIGEQWRHYKARQRFVGEQLGGSYMYLDAVLFLAGGLMIMALGVFLSIQRRG
jgi:hypothetical protein